MGIVKLNANTTVADWFAPSNEDYLNSIDFRSRHVRRHAHADNELSHCGQQKRHDLRPELLQIWANFSPAATAQTVQEWQASPGHIHSSMTLWNSPV